MTLQRPCSSMRGVAGVSWRDLEAAAPELARLGRARLDAARVALLATVRADGTPRISPVEPYLSGDQLLFGAMPWSAKVRDLKRSPRCTLHSAVTGPDAGEGELKLYGRAVEADEQVREACRDGWWTGRPRDAAVVLALAIEEAVFVGWELDRGRMRISRWTPADGLRERARRYP